MSIALAVVVVMVCCCLTALAMFAIEQRSAAASKKLPPVDPQQLLAERYARGEIDEIEYAERLSVLRMGPPLHTYLER